MNASRWASVAALLAGVTWVVSAVLGWGGEPERFSYLAGLVLLVVAFAAGGYALVATAPVWLRAVVTLATPVLGFMLWLVVRDTVGPDYLAVVVVGVLLIVGGGIGLGRAGGGADDKPEPPIRGRRAAR